MKAPVRIGIAVSIWITSFFYAPFCFTQEEKLSPTLERGIGLYKHENFDEALDVLKRAREEDPSSTLAAYYLGLNYKQLQNYKMAISNLRDAVTYTPKIKGALIELVDCLYNYSELEEAHKWIAEAEREGIRPAQVAFLKGLVLIKEEKYNEAVASFENAKALDHTMAQASNYQIGITQLKSKEYASAKKTFEDVIALESSSPLAKFAGEYMDAINRRQQAIGKPWQLSFRTAWEYDDNVVLKPDGDIGANIDDEEDWRTVYTTDIAHTYRSKDGDFTLKAEHLLYYAKQNDLGFYDTLTNSIVVQPSFYQENNVLTFPVTYAHTIVDERSYSSTPTVSGVYNRVFGDKYMGQVFLKYSNKNYLWTPTTSDEDRDSNGLGTGAGWYAFFAERQGYLNFRYGLEREWTKGNNWEYIGHHINATTLIPLFEKFKTTLTGGVFIQDFLNTHTTFGVERADNVYTGAVLLAYNFYKDWEMQLQYTHVHTDSNIEIYQYDRNIYGVGMEVKF